MSRFRARTQTLTTAEERQKDFPVPCRSELYKQKTDDGRGKRWLSGFGDRNAKHTRAR